LTWGYGSSDPRDKIFGILGFSNPTTAIRPDYSLTERKAHIEISAHCLFSIQDTRAITWAAGFRHQHGYPAWIPSFTQHAPGNFQGKIRQLTHDQVYKMSMVLKAAGHNYYNHRSSTEHTEEEVKAVNQNDRLLIYTRLPAKNTDKGHPNRIVSGSL
jgi:hypothetical protein